MLVFYYFESLIGLISFDLSLNIILKSFLVVYLNNQLSSFVNSKMNSQKLIFMLKLLKNEFELGRQIKSKKMQRKNRNQNIK